MRAMNKEHLDDLRITSPWRPCEDEKNPDLLRTLKLAPREMRRPKTVGSLHTTSAKDGGLSIVVLGLDVCPMIKKEGKRMS